MLHRFVRTLAALALAAASPLALAQGSYPSKSVKIVVPYSPGGPADVIARMVAERLSPRLGQPVVIENKPGVGGHLGAEGVAKGAADGYTLVLTTIAHNGAAKLYKKLRYDPGTDLQPVIHLAESPSVLLVHDSVPARSVQELLALLRARPGAMSYASAGNGSAMHMAAELFKHMTKTSIVHIAYRGGAPAMTDLAGGQIEMAFDSVGTAHRHIGTGRVRPIAVTSLTRNPSLPDVPTVAESGVPGYSSVPWYELSAPKGVPAPVVERLNLEINAVLRMPDLVQRWESMGVVPLGGSAADAARRNRQETEKWDAVIAAAGLQVE